VVNTLATNARGPRFDTGQVLKEIGLVMGSPDDICKYLPVIISFLSSCMRLLFRFVSLSYSIVVYLALYIAASYPC